MKYIGIDLGGTHIAIGIVDDIEGLLYKDECATLAHRSYDKVVADMISLSQKVIIDSKVNKDEIMALGIGVPGIETPDGMSYAKNLYWDAVPLANDISRALELKVYIDNDANAAALAEMGFGSLKGTKEALMLTLGTGVGGAMIINGKIYSGFLNAGGELGHFTFIHGGYQCSCGRKGCFEKYAAAPALIRIAREKAQNYPNSVLHTFNGLSAKNVVDSVRENDEAAVEAFDLYVNYLAQGVISFINILNPEKISIGGGLSQAGDILFDRLRAACIKDAFMELHNSTQIVPALLKNDAGILGAAMVAQQGLCE